MTTKKSSEKKRKIPPSSPHNKIADLEEEINKLNQELKEKNDKLIRSYADFQNYQKRVEKDYCNREEDIKKMYFLLLLDIRDLLQQAINDPNPKEGLKLILNNLDNLFEKENIRNIECIGKPFDHSLHHAITTIEKKDCDDGMIIEEIKKGYCIGDKLLRPAQVVVAINKHESSQGGTEHGENSRN